MFTRHGIRLRSVHPPDGNPPEIGTSWPTHYIEAYGTDDDDHPMVVAMWRLRVAIRVDDRLDAAPWSYAIRHFVEVAHVLANGRTEWCPVTAYDDHDKALAFLEAQSRRIGAELT